MDIDRDLVIRTLDGDQKAFAELVERYEHDVHQTAYFILHDACEAEDAAQEVFLRVFRKLHRYDIQRPFKTWLLSITSNHCIDRLRRRRITQISINDLLPSHDVFVSSMPTPEQETMASSRTDTLLSMLKELTVAHRSVVVMYYWFDMSCHEIAEVLNVKEGTVKSRLFRARRALADQLIVSDGILYAESAQNRI